MKRTPKKPTGERRPFRSVIDHGEALAIDPGGSGLIAALRRGVQPTPAAFGSFPESPPMAFDSEATVDGIATLLIDGPLEHRSAWCWPSYEVIEEQATLALDAPDVRALVLRIDSPGGVVAGLGECYRALRKLQARTGKPIFAFVDEMACSAAYHLAAACAEIWLPPAGQVGSIGVILCTIDETEALKKQGVAVRYVVSGAYKADMHPGQPVTDDVIARAQAKIDYLAGLFFRAVSKSRGMSPEKVDALNAAVFQGDAAVTAGLADGVASWPDFMALVRSLVRSGTIPKNRATTPGAGSTTSPKAKIMARTLALKAALDAAKKTSAHALEALMAKPSSAARKAAFEAAVAAESAATSALASAGTAGAKMVKETYTKTSEEEEEAAATSAAPSSSEKPSVEKSEPAAEESSEESEKPSTEKSEPESMADEKDEEAAKVAAFASADRAYRAKTKGFDAYAVTGPKRLLAAVMKATGQTTIAGAMGALAALPKRAAAEKAIAAKVDKLEREGRAERVAAIVEKAKAEGRAPSKAMRAQLRELGADKGSKWLAGYVATLPALMRTTADGARAPKIDAIGNSAGDLTPEQTKMIATMTAGMTPEAAAKFREQVMATRAPATPATPKH